MPEFEGSGRKNTGRKDKFSDENPLKDYHDYRKEYKKDTAREDMKKDGKIDVQKRSAEVILQEIISHKQNEKETFSPEEHNEFYTKLKKLRHEWYAARRREKIG